LAEKEECHGEYQKQSPTFAFDAVGNRAVLEEQRMALCKWAKPWGSWYEARPSGTLGA
jgi:hypothetical protein